MLFDAEGAGARDADGVAEPGLDTRSGKPTAETTRTNAMAAAANLRRPCDT
jgi:hypothetical protein